MKTTEIKTVIKLFNEVNIYATAEAKTPLWIDNTQTCGYIITDLKEINILSIEELKEKGIKITCIEIAKKTKTLILFWTI